MSGQARWESAEERLARMVLEAIKDQDNVDRAAQIIAKAAKAKADKTDSNDE